MEDSATRPDFINTIRQARADVEDERAKSKGLDPEDAALYEMSQTRGWEIAKRIISSLTSELDEIVNKAIEKGADFRDIGILTMIARETKDKLESFVFRIDGSREIVKQGEG